jgi:hypothetical protein
LITAEQLQTLTSFTPQALSRALAVSGYQGREFQTARFLGITNGGQFCYSVRFYDQELEEDTQGKVFLTHNTDGSVTADY